jgi:hypothetical protein
MLPQIFLLILWTTIDPLKLIEVQVDPLRPLFNFRECYSESWTLAYINIAYICVRFIIAIYLAYRTKDLDGSYSMFNEAKEIASAIYVYTFGIILIVAVQIVLSRINAVTNDLKSSARGDASYPSKDAELLIRSFGYIAICFTGICILFAKRILIIFQLIIGIDLTNTTTKSMIHNTKITTTKQTFKTVDVDEDKKSKNKSKKQNYIASSNNNNNNNNNNNDDK